ncbi:hypothetical protein CAPTEDRAFT_215614 [Capitella teleta]|uniref:Uncharacterized protein n=1 Tax=Capitella teleta TaxID=283909 RepID=R7UXJ6_CAPTE|nr:hypothetical protein CAPTEDRAFT_215614 [Capitella teleta]|eukprot:ELU11059.1 hypothetical protein CAPTEDRAFT_215614 [Capitella teleta]
MTLFGLFPQIPDLSIDGRKLQRTKYEESIHLRASVRVSSYLASWGADTPFAHLREVVNLVKNIETTNVAMIEESLTTVSCFLQPRECCNSDEIDGVTLQMRDKSMAEQWFHQSDTNFKFSVIVVDITLIIVCVIQALTTKL